ncbi:hypothetical protein [Catellatospora citrea]|uniref:Arsenate reductase n=1 Tax=Catellatospora citrea TaxID=53366 RepID=A0A8J3KPI9_9ACTN|nr:hypothetical protein [Catellatospora citrea]RKE10482.1 hypothetical protein C8E86_5385 [Catellatospora citrea]GIF99009.1 hypothetical protein Cci01nite_41030 [Catellatospora citrea]
MTESTPGLAWVAQACTLPTAHQPLRLAEFDALFATEVRTAERVDDTHLRLTMTGGPGLEASVRDLAARESACCSFFTFAVSANGSGQVTFDIKVPPASTDVLAALAERADTVRGRR